MDIFFDFVQNNKQRIKPLGIAAISICGVYGKITLSKILTYDADDEEQQQNNENKRPAGIMNQGNTCFVNSLLQALASVQTFKSNIESLLKITVPSDNNEQLIVELNKVIKKINNNSQNISVMDLLDILSTQQQNLINFQQQDTYELYSAIVRAFDQFYNKRKQSNLSISHINLNTEIENCLLGYTKSTIQCMACKNTMTIKIHSFYDLSLEILPTFITSLKNALLWYQRKQKIQNYTCTFCSVKAHIDKLERIAIRLKKQQKWGNELSKVNQKLINYLKKQTFEDLDLKQINCALQNEVTEFTDIFTLIGDNVFRNEVFSLIKPVDRDIIKQTKITKYPKFLVIHFKQLIINPYTGEPAYMKKAIDYQSQLTIQQKTHSKIYKLTSLLTHIGNEQMGHYFTFRKQTKQSEEWFLISDTHTERVTQQKMRRHVPYMLFYELDEQNYEKDQIAKSIREKYLLQDEQQQQMIQRCQITRLSQQICLDFDEDNLPQNKVINQKQKLKQNGDNQIEEKKREQKIKQQKMENKN